MAQKMTGIRAHDRKIFSPRTQGQTKTPRPGGSGLPNWDGAQREQGLVQDPRHPKRKQIAELATDLQAIDGKLRARPAERIPALLPSQGVVQLAKIRGPISKKTVELTKALAQAEQPLLDNAE